MGLGESWRAVHPRLAGPWCDRWRLLFFAMQVDWQSVHLAHGLSPPSPPRLPVWLSLIVLAKEFVLFYMTKEFVLFDPAKQLSS